MSKPAARFVAARPDGAYDVTEDDAQGKTLTTKTTDGAGLDPSILEAARAAPGERFVVEYL